MSALMSNAVHRVFMLLLLFALPAWAAALDFGFEPPRNADDAAAATVMRDLAQRIVPVYHEADADLYRANMMAMQIVSGAYVAADDTSQALRDRHQGKPIDGPLGRAIIDGLYARARAVEAKDHTSFAEAYARSFREVMLQLDDAHAAAVIARLQTPLAVYRQPVQEAFDRWRTKGSIPEADAVALVRSYVAYESHRSYAVLIPALAAAEEGRRYAVEADVAIPVRPGLVIHARVVRPVSAKGTLPTLLRFTIDPAEDDAKASATHGYVGVTAYVRGRKANGRGAVWPFLHDGDDAKGVIDWIAKQPWSDGRVGMLGDGYSGFAAWAAAARKPAALKGIATTAPMAPGIDFPLAGQIFRNAMARWTQQHTLTAPLAAEQNDDARWQMLDQAWYRSGRVYPDIDRILLGKRSKLLRTWLTHPSRDRYWQKLMPTARQFAQIDVPVLTIAGYYGADAGALYYDNEHRRQRPKADDTLLIGPYDADSIRTGTAATLRGYALDAAAQVDLNELRYQWFDHLFKAAKKPPLLQDRVNYEVMGANEWRHAPMRDAPDGKLLRLYLDPGVDPQKRDAPPRLSLSKTEGDDRVDLVVDLADRSDASVPWPDALRPAQLPTRNAIAFVGEPLARDTEIDGSLRGEFEITPSTQDVDFNVALYEQTSSGAYRLLFEPYDFRASYAGDRVHRKLLVAGERQSLAFTTERMTATRLPAGSRIVLVVGINKRPDRQIDYGSGKAVNSETIADAKAPMRVRWHARGYVEMQSGKP